MSLALAPRQVVISEELAPPQKIDTAGKRRALFSSEMQHLLVSVGFLLVWDEYMQSDIPLVQGC